MSNPAPKPSPNTCGLEHAHRTGHRRRTAASLALATLLAWPGQPAPLHAKTILAYYLAWYAAPPHSTEWGWHWTMDRFQPDRINALGEREIASWYQPWIGPYDSGDTVALEYHALLMRIAGVDAVVINWFGPENVFDYARIDQNLCRFLPLLEQAGLQWALCFEDRSLQAPEPANPRSDPDPIPRAISILRHAARVYFNHPNYLRWQGRPVLLNFGPQVLRNPGQWQQVLNSLDPPPALFTINTPAPGAVGAFAWPPMWLSQAPGTDGVLSETALHRYLTDFEQSARTWPAAISTAFPRFHDIHPRAGVRGYWGYLGDRAGATFRQTLQRALTNATPMAMIATWNDFGEGTQIEPTREFGLRDLLTLQELRRTHVDPAFPGTPQALELVRRLYLHRRCSATNSARQAELDAAARALGSFQFKEAAALLPPLEPTATRGPGRADLDTK